jgi:O-antigen/teichoic acid export membrane protein
VIARTLGPDETGRYPFAVWVTSLLAALAQGGIPTAMTRFMAKLAARR